MMYQDLEKLENRIKIQEAYIRDVINDKSKSAMRKLEVLESAYAVLDKLKKEAAFYSLYYDPKTGKMFDSAGML